MIDPTAISPLKLSSAKPYSFLMPFDKYGIPFVIGIIEQQPFAVYLGENHKFRGFFPDGSQNWQGAVIKGTRFEVDKDSAFDASYERRLGSLIRKDGHLFIAATKMNGGFGQVTLVQLAEGIDLGDPDIAIGFSKWTIVIGSELKPITLFESDISEVVV